ARAIGRLLAGPPAAQAPAYAAPPRIAQPRPRVAAAPATRRLAGRGTQQSLRGALLPVALSLAIGLLPVAGAVMHDALGHIPPPRPWGQGYSWHHWHDGRADRSWTWWMAPHHRAP